MTSDMINHAAAVDAVALLVGGDLSPEERQQRGHLLADLLGGIAHALDLADEPILPALHKRVRGKITITINLPPGASADDAARRIGEALRGRL